MSEKDLESDLIEKSFSEKNWTPYRIYLGKLCVFCEKAVFVTIIH